MIWSHLEPRFTIYTCGGKVVGTIPNVMLAPGPGLWSLNWNEWTEFVWTENGPGMDLVLSLTTSHCCHKSDIEFSFLFLCTESWWDIYKEIWDVIKCKILQILISFDLTTNNAELLAHLILSPDCPDLQQGSKSLFTNQTELWGSLSEDLTPGLRLRLHRELFCYSLLESCSLFILRHWVRAGRRRGEQSRADLPFSLLTLLRLHNNSHGGGL